MLHIALFPMASAFIFVNDVYLYIICVLISYNHFIKTIFLNSDYPEI